MVHIWISHNTLFHCWEAHFLEIPCFEAHNPFCHPAGSTLNSWAEVVWKWRQWGEKTHGLHACRRGSKDPYFLCNLLYFTVVKLPLRTKRAVCYPNCVPYCTFVPDGRWGAPFPFSLLLVRDRMQCTAFCTQLIRIDGHLVLELCCAAHVLCTYLPLLSTGGISHRVLVERCKACLITMGQYKCTLMGKALRYCHTPAQPDSTSLLTNLFIFFFIQPFY